MGEVRYAAVRSRAFREARAEVRLDSPVRIVTGVISPFASTAIVWWATGSLAWGGVAGVGVLLFVLVAVFAIKLFTVPVAMANEAYAERDQISGEMTEKLAALERQVAILTAPPPPPTRDPNGIYQFGRVVGQTQNVQRLLGQGIVVFGHLSCSGDFNEKAEFEYQDLVLRMESCEVSGSISGLAASPTKGFQQARCSVIRVL